MGNKRKGQLTTDSEWHKHLRKISKRFFWKGERKAGKKLIEDQLVKNETLFISFDELFDLIDEDKLNDDEKIIAGKIIEAERDWRTQLESLNDFIDELENEFGEPITVKSINRVLKIYNRHILKFAWEYESVSNLLEIFDYSEEKDLRNIFKKLSEKQKITK